MSEKNTRDYESRLREMTHVLRRHGITKGLTPLKLRCILEDLGPTFIKLGQIASMHSDVLPKRYCDELLRLQTEVAPCDFAVIRGQMENAYGRPLNEVFRTITKEPLGSASIAQVHRGTLLSGEEVVIKVQKPGIYETMARDISLLRKAVRFMPGIGLKGTVDFDMVLDELWAVTREELDFCQEANHMEEFEKKNADIRYLRVPKLYRAYSSMHVLVMEYIDGIAINDRERLLEGGYDLNEIGSKLVENYVKQFMDDGFFHADPHAGNVKVWGGQIVYLDMGMMGRLGRRDRHIIGEGIRGIASDDVGLMEDAVMALGDYDERPDQVRLHEDISDLFAKYGMRDMGEICVSEAFTDLLDVMKEHGIRLPHGLTMLARGLTHMEGVLKDIAPEINIVSIASLHMKQKMLEPETLKKILEEDSRNLLRSYRKAILLPQLATEILEGTLKGQTKVNLDLHPTPDLEDLLRRIFRNVVMGLWIVALLVSSSILCTTHMEPQILGIPALGALGYILAFALMFYVFVRHMRNP